MLADDEALRQTLDPIPETWQGAAGLRRAAVLAPLVQRAGEDHLLFTLRPDDLPQHAGQVSFPGGGIQAQESPRSCALREAEEEIGLDPDATQLLGSLPVLTSSSAYRVHTLVARIRQLEFRPDPREVAALLWVPLRLLAADQVWEQRSQTRGGRTFRPTPHFAFQGHTIWGLTGILTTRLLARMKWGS